MMRSMWLRLCVQTPSHTMAAEVLHLMIFVALVSETLGASLSRPPAEGLEVEGRGWGLLIFLLIPYIKQFLSTFVFNSSSWKHLSKILRFKGIRSDWFRKAFHLFLFQPLNMLCFHLIFQKKNENKLVGKPQRSISNDSQRFYICYNDSPMVILNTDDVYYTCECIYKKIYLSKDELSVRPVNCIRKILEKCAKYAPKPTW